MPRCCCLSFLVIKPNQGVRQEKRQTRERERTTDAKEQMLAGCPGLPTRPLIYRHKQELGEWTRVEWRAQRAVSVQFRFSSLLFSSCQREREKEREYSFLFCQRGGMVKCAAHLVVDPRSARHCIDPRLQQSLNPSFFFFYSRRDCVKIKKKLKHFGLARSLDMPFNPPQSTAPYSAANKKKKKIIRLCLTSIFIYWLIFYLSGPFMSIKLELIRWFESWFHYCPGGARVVCFYSSALCVRRHECSEAQFRVSRVHILIVANEGVRVV